MFLTNIKYFKSTQYKVNLYHINVILNKIHTKIMFSTDKYAPRSL